jgi:hypothetical protein
MVYCTKCGAENKDDMRYCVKCGQPLYPSREEARMYRREREEMCFGAHWAPGAWALFFGIIIVLAGIVWWIDAALGLGIDVWPLIVIAFGIMIIIGVLSRPRR